MYPPVRPPEHPASLLSALATHCLRDPLFRLDGSSWSPPADPPDNPQGEDIVDQALYLSTWQSASSIVTARTHRIGLGTYVRWHTIPAIHASAYYVTPEDVPDSRAPTLPHTHVHKVHDTIYPINRKIQSPSNKLQLFHFPHSDTLKDQFVTWRLYPKQDIETLAFSAYSLDVWYSLLNCNVYT